MITELKSIQDIWRRMPSEHHAWTFLEGLIWPNRQTDDRASGEINWLIDVIAPDRKTAAAVIGNFKQVVKSGQLRMHPIVGRLVDPEVLEKLGVTQTDSGSGRSPGETASNESDDSQ